MAVVSVLSFCFLLISSEEWAADKQLMTNVCRLNCDLINTFSVISKLITAVRFNESFYSWSHSFSPIRVWPGERHSSHSAPSAWPVNQTRKCFGAPPVGTRDRKRPNFFSFFFFFLKIYLRASAAGQLQFPYCVTWWFNMKVYFMSATTSR